MLFRIKNVRDWFSELPEDLRTKAISRSTMKTLAEPASCLSHALLVGFIWREDEEWAEIYKKNMPNMAMFIVENRSLFNLSEISRRTSMRRQTLEDYLRDEDKHSFELNESLTLAMTSMVITLNEVTRTRNEVELKG